MKRGNDIAAGAAREAGQPGFLPMRPRGLPPAQQAIAARSSNRKSLRRGALTVSLETIIAGSTGTPGLCRPALGNQLVDVGREGVVTIFNAQTDPDGYQWAPLSSEYCADQGPLVPGHAHGCGDGRDERGTGGRASSYRAMRPVGRLARRRSNATRPYAFRTRHRLTPPAVRRVHRRFSRAFARGFRDHLKENV